MVVVFPCEPEMAMPFFLLKMRDRKTALFKVGIFNSPALFNSTLSGGIAEEYTTSWVSLLILSEQCPI